MYRFGVVDSTLPVIRLDVPVENYHAFFFNEEQEGQQGALKKAVHSLPIDSKQTQKDWRAKFLTYVAF